jgi:nitroimidazol reductase NimA-like FMN-containing flavoprotein (pyridoxamine 5'-phosphate oxidase superfamily)
MRRKDKEIKSKSEIKSIIKSGKVCRLGLSNNDEPYIVPMNYGFKNNFLFFHCAKQGKKLEMIKKNNRVCFEIETENKVINTGLPCDWKNTYSSVIGFGRAELVKNHEEKVKALNIIVGHYSPGTKYEFSKDKVTKTAIIKVIIDEFTGKKSIE